jgi:hypothetical protein
VRKHKVDTIDPHYVKPPYISDASNEAYTRLFLIRYVDEACYIGEIFCMRVEIENYSPSTAIPLLVETDLLFCDINQVGGIDGLNSHKNNVLELYS